MNTPFYNKIKELSQNKINARFFVPGHKGNNPLNLNLFENFWQMDLTEIAGADNLMLPQQELLQSERNMSALYNSGATLYSASGSTSCIQAMFFLFCPPGSTVIAGRNCHISALRAMAFLNLHPTWLMPGKNGTISPESIETALCKAPSKTVYITSPDYYGNISDIKSISKICKKYNANLIVDNAHGAYLKFINKDKTDMHPLTLGADATADSAHKTLPCLTPAALLHIKNPALKTAARNALNMFSSTSPSYLVLCSLDIAAGLLSENLLNFDNSAKKLFKIKSKVNNYSENCDDPLRLRLNANKAGYTAVEMEDILLKNGIPVEMRDEIRLILMAGPCNTDKEFNLLENVLANIKLKKPILHNENYVPSPIIKKSPHESFFSPSEYIKLENSMDKICAAPGILGPVANMPMGVPAILPGELITQKHIQLLANGGITHINVLK